MRDLQSQLGNHPSYKGGGGSGMKKCACGREITRSGTDICGVCFSKQKNSTVVTTSTSASTNGFSADYLSGGYLTERNGKYYIKEEVYTSWALEASTKLKQQFPKMTSTKLRAFFNKLRAVEFRYKEAGRDFFRAQEGLFKLKSDVKYPENRNITPALFTTFIEKNVDLAKKDEENFRAFVHHFESVIAYFKD